MVPTLSYIVFPPSIACSSREPINTKIIDEYMNMREFFSNEQQFAKQPAAVLLAARRNIALH
jgi:hypothetical protein